MIPKLGIMIFDFMDITDTACGIAGTIAQPQGASSYIIFTFGDV